jgi:rod shape determining protein RodA
MAWLHSIFSASTTIIGVQMHIENKLVEAVHLAFRHLMIALLLKRPALFEVMFYLSDFKHYGFDFGAVHSAVNGSHRWLGGGINISPQRAPKRANILVVSRIITRSI